MDHIYRAISWIRGASQLGKTDNISEVFHVERSHEMSISCEKFFSNDMTQQELWHWQAMIGKFNHQALDL